MEIKSSFHFVISIYFCKLKISHQCSTTVQIYIRSALSSEVFFVFTGKLKLEFIAYENDKNNNKEH
jgi:hypothetical protein